MSHFASGKLILLARIQHIFHSKWLRSWSGLKCRLKAHVGSEDFSDNIHLLSWTNFTAKDSIYQRGKTWKVQHGVAQIMTPFYIFIPKSDFQGSTPGIMVACFIVHFPLWLKFPTAVSPIALSTMMKIFYMCAMHCAAISMVATSHMWLLSTWNMTEELNLKLHLILI